jgi:hypothetical protein
VGEVVQLINLMVKKFGGKLGVGAEEMAGKVF